MRIVTVLLLAVFLLLPWVVDAQQPADTTRYGIAPKYEVRVEMSVRVPMRDGVRLSTDLYFPVGAPEPHPVIQIRLPYNKKKFWGFRQPDSIPYFFASQGYVVAVQDMRGQWESEGEYVVGRADRDDGYDTVDWLSRQPWSNGKIGSYGCSYLGENQIQLAATRHPNHAAAIPQAAGGAYMGTFRTFIFVDGGAFELASGLGWFSRAGFKVKARLPSDLSDEDFQRLATKYDPGPAPVDIDLRKAFWSLPIIDILKDAGAPPNDYEDFVSHGPADPYWASLNYVSDNDRFDVPALHVNSWYDGAPKETMDVFNLMRTNAESARGGDHQYVIMSPTSHCLSESVTADTLVGERDLGDPRLKYWEIYLRWFDFWLKGEENGVTDMPKVQYYLMGANEWRSAETWPVEGATPTTYYLHSEGRANSRFGDGRLSTEPPEDEPSDRYTYDPATPVPSVGGPICCISDDDAAAGGYDQSEVEMRHDVLVYTSDVLEEGVEVTGELTAVLYVSSSARDTDFTIKLVDVYPDGRAFNVQDGILRARYREGYDKVVLMEEGEVYKIPIDLHVTSNYFGPGHRIRVDISSSNFPRTDRNLNTGGNNYDESEWVQADNVIHHSTQYPSHVVLPIVRR